MGLKKSLGLIILIACAIIISYKLVDVSPQKNLLPHQRVHKIFRYGECAACHSDSYELPFYINCPIVGKKIKQNIEQAKLKFILDSITSPIKEKQVINKSELDKLEKSFIEESMPPMRYYLLHWGTVINRNEKSMMLEWIDLYKKEHYIENNISQQN